MDLPPSARLRAVTAQAAQQLPLTPEEFFVFSRIEGAVTVADVLHASGMPQAAAEAALRRLIELAAVKVEIPIRRSSPIDRRRQHLVAQLAAARRATPVVLDTAEALPPLPERVEDDDEPARDEEPPPPWPRVGPSDPRLDAALDLDLEEQRRVLGLIDRLDDLSPFEMLGIWPTHDLKRIRRAYHDASRTLHPDTYYGDEIGPYRAYLAALFRRATQAHEALRDPELRTPYVDAELARKAEAQRRNAQLSEQQRERERVLREQEEAEAAMRRHDRAVTRARRQRERLSSAIKAQIAVHVKEASEAEKQGNMARAANLYRLALQLHPGDGELEALWARCRVEARRKRGTEAFARAMSLRDYGQTVEAVPLLVEAAEADPQVDHLAWAAEAIAVKDPVRGHRFALAALDGLRGEAASEKGPRRRPQDLHKLHVLLAKAFVALGQKHTARELLGAIDTGTGKAADPEVRALLNSIKLP